MSLLHHRRVSANYKYQVQAFRLDMTPLADLAFLLLTFFMLTTKPHVMQLTMPAATRQLDEDMGSCGRGVVTVIVGKNHQVHYYLGLNNPNDASVPTPQLFTTDFSSQGIRQALLKLQEGEAPYQFVVLIKLTQEAHYGDMVDILDEMNITNQKRYALVKITAPDTKLLQQAGY
jgi:biopolymer transport protein ExbD